MKLRIRPRRLCLVVACPRSGTTAISRWLGSQTGLVAVPQSRILLAAHHFLEQVGRFRRLHAAREMLTAEARRLVYAYYASSHIVWRTTVIDKENPEPIGFPDGRYGDYLDSVREIFPDVKLLFIIRDPVATIWSMIHRQWGQTLTEEDQRTYSLDECIEIWRSCAELIHDHASAANVYVCRFERLIADPAAESRRIFDFLSVRGGETFRPQPTSEVRFSEADRQRILGATERQRQALQLTSPDPACST